MSEEKIRITQTKSIIGALKKQKATIKALRLGRPHYFVEVRDDPRIRGQIRKVEHLVRVDKIGN